MTRYLQLLPIVCLSVMTACNSPTHSDAKMEAQQRWNHVRGRVKYQLARQQCDSGLFDEAVRTATESISLDSDQVDVYALLARANLELGKTASAWQALRTAGRRGLDSSDLVYMQGVILEQRDQLEAASEKYAQARSIDPANVDYLVAHAECLTELDRPIEAIQLLDKRANWLDDDATIPTLAAHVASLIGDRPMASRRFEQALLADAAHPLVAEELGRLLVQQQRYDEAIAVLDPIIARSGDDDGAYGAVRRSLASCHLALDDPVLAKNVLFDYAQRSPDDALAQLLLAKAAIATHDTLTALRAIDLAEQREPGRPELWLVRAAVRWKRGNLAGAAADLYDILANNPDDVEAHCLLAEVLHSQRRSEAAEEHFHRALDIDPTCAWASAGLASVERNRPRPLANTTTPKLTSAEHRSEPAVPPR